MVELVRVVAEVVREDAACLVVALRASCSAGAIVVRMDNQHGFHSLHSREAVGKPRKVVGGLGRLRRLGRL